MKIIIQTPDFTLTKKLEKFVHDHIQKLNVVNSEILEGRVCLKLDNSDTNDNKICEIKLLIPGNDLFASRQTKVFEESVTKTIEALKHQMEHLKTAREKQRTK